MLPSELMVAPFAARPRVASYKGVIMPKDSRFEDVNIPMSGTATSLDEIKEKYRRGTPIDRMPTPEGPPPIGKELGKALGVSPKTKVEAVPMPIPDDFKETVTIGGKNFEFDSKPKFKGDKGDLRLLKKGGKVNAKPKASSASRRGDGIALRGKTKGRIV